jgi:hypothetical protein
MVLTEEDLKLLKSKEVKEEQPLNILFIFSTCEVSNSEKSIFIIFFNPLNIDSHVVNE